MTNRKKEDDRRNAFLAEKLMLVSPSSFTVKFRIYAAHIIVHYIVPRLRLSLETYVYCVLQLILQLGSVELS